MALGAAAALMAALLSTAAAEQHFKVMSSGLYSCDSRPMPVQIVNATLSAEAPFTLVVKGKLIVSQQIDGPLMAFARAKRCKGGMCAKLLPYSHPDLCDALPQRDTVAEPIMRLLEGFPRECPIPPGEYELKEYRIVETEPSTAQGHWKLYIKIASLEAVVLCYKAEVDIEVEDD